MFNSDSVPKQIRGIRSQFLFERKIAAHMLLNNIFIHIYKSFIVNSYLYVLIVSCLYCQFCQLEQLDYFYFLSPFDSIRVITTFIYNNF
jgi:hypothetical protein